jgi:hypothetical protein
MLFHCTVIADLERDGFTWARRAASADIAGLDSLAGNHRNALDIEQVVALLNESPLRSLVRDALGVSAFCVRGILFDKTRASNWGVPWHQDLSIAVRERVEFPGFGPWSIKAGIQHAVAPASVLTRMVATRIHIDPCGPNDGPLRVVARTHLAKLRDDAAHAGTDDYTLCTAERGDVLLMRPLLLHASTKASSPSRRRVLHLEWASDPLPPPLRWRWMK